MIEKGEPMYEAKNRKLPKEAYDALTALKAEASVAGEMLDKKLGNKTADDADLKQQLAQAHKQMQENEPWTTRIIKGLTHGDGSVNIDNVTPEWLESVVASA